MSNDNRWQGEEWEPNSNQPPRSDLPEPGSPPQPPTFGYFDRPAQGPSYPQYGEYSNYGQFGQPSGDYQSAPYSGYDSSPFPLHPLSPVEQIDAAIRLVRYNPKVLIVLPLIVYLLVGLLSTAVVLIGGESSLTSVDIFDVADTATSTAFVVTSLITTLISFIAGLFIYTTAVNAAMSALYGRKISMGQAVSMSAGDSGRLALAYLVYAIIFAVVTAVLGFAVAPLVGDIGVAGNSILFLVFFAASIYLAVRFSCVIPVLVAEQKGPIASIARSFELTKGRFWHILATLILSIILILFMTIVVSIVIGIGSIFTFGASTAIVIYSTITGALLSALVVAFGQAVSNVIYINLRMIRENFHYSIRNS